jgi:hypothetical protein
VISPAMNPILAESSKDRIWIRLMTAWSESGTEHWQLVGRSTGPSRTADTKWRSEHILKGSLRHVIRQKVVELVLHVPNSLEVEV